MLVWRANDGSVQHAAVTLGEGWALNKPSQGWMSPTLVLSVSDAKFGSRSPGLHLHRRGITAGIRCVGGHCPSSAATHHSEATLSPPTASVARFASSS